MKDRPLDDFAGRVGRLLYREAALAYPESKRAFVEERVRAFMDSAGLSEAELVARLETDPALRSACIEALTIHETRFFRIPAQFEALRHLVPPFVERRRLRAWVAACSTGEEAYSLAMALQALGESRAEILATDLSRAVLQKAQRARYAPERLENLPPGYRTSYFEAIGGELAVKPSVRAMVRFEAHNLKVPCPPGPWDLIWCRNVMIYFDNAFRADLLERLYRALTPGGYLFVGEAETLHLVPHRFRTLEVGSALVYQRPADAGP